MAGSGNSAIGLSAVTLASFQKYIQETFELMKSDRARWKAFVLLV